MYFAKHEDKEIIYKRPQKKTKEIPFAVDLIDLFR